MCGREEKVNGRVQFSVGVAVTTDPSARQSLNDEAGST